MPGIFGLVDPSSPPEASRALVGQMAAALRHRPDCRLSTLADGPASLGCLSLGLPTDQPGPVFNRERTRVLLFAGELYDTHRHWNDRMDGRPASDSDLVLALFEQRGEGCLPDLHGVFTFAVWDAGERRLLLANDRFGLWPIYYCVRGGRLLFAPEAKGILADSGLPRTVNDRAVMNLLHFGHVLGDETLFTDITLLPPGSVLEWRDGRVSLRSYWDIQLPETYRAQPKAEVVEHAASLTHQAVQRLSGGPHGSRAAPVRNNQLPFCVSVNAGARSRPRLSAPSVGDTLVGWLGFYSS